MGMSKTRLVHSEECKRDYPIGIKVIKNKRRKTFCELSIEDYRTRKNSKFIVELSGEISPVEQIG